MDPLIIAAGISAAASGGNAAATAKMNKKTREWNEKMYGIQRQDALQDWMRQNEYNSPAAQMARLKQAGLNPHLIYGGGPGNVSQAVRGTDAKSWNPQVPQVNLDSAINSAFFKQYDLRLKDAQKDQVAENIKLTRDKQLETQAKAAGILASSAKTKQQIAQSEQLFGYTLEQAKLNNRNSIANIESTLTKNEQLKMMFSPTLEAAVINVLQAKKNLAKTQSEINQIDQAIKNAKQDNEIKQLDIDIKKLGIQPTDNMFLRMGARILNGIFNDKPKDQTWQKDYNKPNNILNR
jgi:hypothetical protein